MSSLKDCPYLWEISLEDEITYVFAENSSDALKIAEKEFNDVEEIHLKVICFANDIINLKELK